MQERMQATKDNANGSRKYLKESTEMCKQRKRDYRVNSLQRIIQKVDVKHSYQLNPAAQCKYMTLGP